METVEVNVHFFGPIAAKAGMKEMSLPIRAQRELGVEDIIKLVKDKAGDQILFTILLNGSSIDLGSNDFAQGDEVRIVPVVLGG